MSERYDGGGFFCLGAGIIALVIVAVCALCCSSPSEPGQEPEEKRTMRCLFEDRAYNDGTSYANIFKITKVGPRLFEDVEYNDGTSYSGAYSDVYDPAPYAIRINSVTLPSSVRPIHLWFWVGATDAGHAEYIYAYGARAEAWAAADAGTSGDNWLAKNEALTAGVGDYELTDNPANGPNLTGLTINAVIGRYVIDPLTFDAIWGLGWLPGYPVDLWFWIHTAGSYYIDAIYAYSTRAEAWAAADAEDAGETWLWKIDTGASIIGTNTIYLEPASNADDPPDHLILETWHLFLPHETELTWEQIWAWTCAPCLATMDNLIAILKDHTGAGKALEDFDSNTAFNVGALTDPVPSAMPMMAMRSTGLDLIGSIAQGESEHVRCNAELEIGCQVLDSPEAAWLQCQRYARAVHSILCDENRTGYGEIVTVQYDAWDPPTFVGQSPIWVATKLYIGVEFVEILIQ